MFIEPTGTEMNLELLQKYIDKHKEQFPHYKELFDAYKGDYPILHKDEKPQWKPDNRLVVNYAKYITDTMNGFFIGIPIKVSHPDKEIADYMNYLDQYNDQDDNNAELSKICSIYGHGYEMLFTDEYGEIGITYMNPMDCFIIYDDSILRRPMYAIRWYIDSDNVLRGSWSDGNYIQYFKQESEYVYDGIPTPHYFGDVPIIEYVENEEKQGIYENVLTLINEYNKAISEKANDVDYYADAYLKILGAKLKEETLTDLRSNRIINFSGEGTDDVIVEFMQKPDADGTQEHLIERLEKLIFQISMVANISEESFGSSSSGIALKYRLQSMNNLRKTKERKFTSGMNRRYKMIAHCPASKMNEDSWIDITYQFTANLPANLLEESQIAGNLAGITSQKTQLKVLSCVDSADDELDEIEKEQDKEGYDTDYPTDRTGVQESITPPTTSDEAEKALNGAQITSVLSVVQNVRNGMIDLEQARAILVNGLKMSEKQAKDMLG